MPYGVSDTVWRRLPPGDQAAIKASWEAAHTARTPPPPGPPTRAMPPRQPPPGPALNQHQPQPGPTTPPSQTPTPPPAAEGTDVLVPLGLHLASRPGVTITQAPKRPLLAPPTSPSALTPTLQLDIGPTDALLPTGLTLPRRPGITYIPGPTLTPSPKPATAPTPPPSRSGADTDALLPTRVSLPQRPDVTYTPAPVGAVDLGVVPAGGRRLAGSSGSQPGNQRLGGHRNTSPEYPIGTIWLPLWGFVDVTQQATAHVAVTVGNAPSVAFDPVSGSVTVGYHGFAIHDPGSLYALAEDTRTFQELLRHPLISGTQRVAIPHGETPPQAFGPVSVSVEKMSASVSVTVKHGTPALELTVSSSLNVTTPAGAKTSLEYAIVTTYEPEAPKSSLRPASSPQSSPSYWVYASGAAGLLVLTLTLRAIGSRLLEE